MVLEALERIQDAEKKVEEMRQTAQKEIMTYEQKKAQQFKQLQGESQEKVSKILQNQEMQLTEQLEQERILLLSEAKEQNQEFRNKYEQNKEAIVDHIIERVKKVYGSQ
ncbi:hypothetical protein [Enterococcus wangshanyuanii]|uniref:V-type ATPase, subunit F n=1 Tax=Enterococcus wangshanyuanii TaxID=2005703 RepID=A0ABQ1NVC2_9ENTE|nr:hypothetical protein [Enterococcus wangshanyuanii]GGC83813.1 hypothetical protein GCM10011573_11780 [Enterococcus wangshanyuanii]